MIKYKVDIVKALADKGFTATKIRENKLISQATLQNLRQGKNINITTLNDICIMLRCQPNDLIEIVPSDEEKLKFF